MFCEEDDGKEKQSSFLSLFMKVDRHFMTKCFGQMQELGLHRVGRKMYLARYTRHFVLEL